MIGLGKWEFSVKTFVYSGKVFLNIFDNGGKYAYEVSAPGISVPKVEVIDVVENGNTVEATMQTPVLPGKDILVHAEFDGDSVSGYAKIPILGKVAIQDGRRIG